ncbi:hypothetical protein FG386_002166 [Cryptosporidium ryanae]|uniref:uncharacterized protein n=1 Tax=Cryptosporidium ryanae TaxID=515981 RepID=UPI00351AACB1|nr:hypothetical protein FG386_002166 [Cryptosporidium ryanae]
MRSIMPPPKSNKSDLTVGLIDKVSKVEESSGFLKPNENPLSDRVILNYGVDLDKDENNVDTKKLNVSDEIKQNEMNDLEGGVHRGHSSSQYEQNEESSRKTSHHHQNTHRSSHSQGHSHSHRSHRSS